MAFDGKHVILQVDSVTVLGQTSGGMDYTIDALETTTKDDKDPSTGITHKTYILGDRDGTINIEGNTSDDANGWSLLYDLYETQVTPATLVYGGTEPGQKFYTQDGWLTSVSRSDPQNAIGTYSATFQKSGAPTEGTVSA
jgi:hypothetical protein